MPVLTSMGTFAGAAIYTWRHDDRLMAWVSSNRDLVRRGGTEHTEHLKKPGSAQKGRGGSSAHRNLRKWPRRLPSGIRPMGRVYVRWTPSWPSPWAAGMGILVATGSTGR